MGTARANVLDDLEAALARGRLLDAATLVVPHDPGGCDAFLLGRRADWHAHDGRAAEGLLREHPALADVAVDGERNRLDLRLEPDRLAELGAALEGGAPAEPIADTAAGRRYVVDFCDTNATKALHAGHLRIVALGNALAALAAACGADVLRQSQIGDIGRSMGEAMAGYATFADGAEPEPGTKADHFVGRWYSRYVAANALAQDGFSDPALSREDGAHDDLAEQLLARWRAGDPDAVALWERVRAWAMDGQEQTLARLGIRFDRVLFESDFVEATDRVGAAILERGLVARTEDGAIAYETGQEEYPRLLLNRPDGFPTQHLRYIAMWHETRPLLEGTTSLSLMGDEWAPLAVHGGELLRRLAPPGAPPQPSEFVVHGMVTLEDRAVKSSDGEPLLVDALLDELAADPQIAAAAGDSPHATPDRLAAIVLLGAFLARPRRSTMPLAREGLLDARANPAWTIAQAWARAWAPGFDGPPEPLPDDPGYRHVAMRSQLLPRVVAQAFGELDALPLLRSCAHVARWFLAADPPPSVARAMRGLLGGGMAALGLLPVQERAVAAAGAR